MGVGSDVDPCIQEVQRVLRERLCGRVLPATIHGYEKEKRHLHDLLLRTAEFGESNSVLLVGPRGAGKSMLLRCVLEELNQSKEVESNVLEVRLNGLMQTDDRIALREITRQLQLENVVGDKVFGSFAETLQFLLDALKSGGQNTKPILFVLDEFDLFAHHKNQTLLYNLFDISQSAQTPVCVVGLTCRLDVVELLEKRVKSRFSHRQIHLFNNLSFEEYTSVFASSLVLPSDFHDKTFRKEWNANITSLSCESAVLDVLKKQFMMNKDIRALHKLLMLPICQLSAQHPQLKAADLVNASRSHAQDSKAVIIQGLSILELCLIIAMKHMMETYDGEPFNFEMIFSAYQKFAQRQSSLQMFEKAVVLKAFEHLCALELVRPIDGGSSRTQKEYRLMTLLVDPSQVTEALLKYQNCPTDIKQWASQTINV